MWWSAIKQLTFSCVLDMKQFPFDEQFCRVQFASWIYADYQMDITNVSTVMSNAFTSQEWSIVSVEGNRETVKLWDAYDYGFAIYTIR